MVPLVLLLSLFAVFATSLSIASVFRLTARRRETRNLDHRDARPSSDSAKRSITILKPLCGADDQLEANLETFFVQDHPSFELVFGVEGESDPAIPIVRRLRHRYPTVKSRLVIHAGGKALNPKVANLEVMMANVTHDLVVISDSNIAAGPSWLSSLVDFYESDPRHGLVTNLFVGTGEETLGATLENLHLAGPVAGSLAISNELLDNAEAVGKSMMFSRSTFETLGGMSSLGTVLAEDFVMGRMFAQAGYKVAIAPTTVANVTTRTTVQKFFARQLRWSLIRSRVCSVAYPFEPLISPMLPALLSPLAGPFMPAFFALGIALTLVRDAAQWLRLRGRDGLLSALPLGPTKELALLAVWALAPFTTRVAWRGKRFRVAAGSRLYAERPMSAVPFAQWE